MLVTLEKEEEKTQVIRVKVREGKAEKVGEIGGRVSVAGWSLGEAMVAATDG